MRSLIPPFCFIVKLGLALVLFSAATHPVSAWVNPGFETGDLSGWTLSTGSGGNALCTPYALAVGPGPAPHSQGTLCVAPTICLDQVHAGSFAAELDSCRGDRGHQDWVRMEQTDTIPADGRCCLSFWFAAVLSGHHYLNGEAYGSDAYVLAEVLVGGAVVGSLRYSWYDNLNQLVDDGADPFGGPEPVSPNSPMEWRHLPWTPFAVNLCAYAGQQATIRFTVYDCDLGGHNAFGFLDDVSWTSCPNPVLSLSKTNDPPGAVSQGATVTYTLSYANHGTDPISGVTITDTVPAGTSLVLGSISSAPPVPAVGVAGNDIIWSIGSLAPGASGTLSFQVVAEDPCRMILNTAREVDLLHPQGLSSNTVSNTVGGCSPTATVVLTGTATATITSTRTATLAATSTASSSRTATPSATGTASATTTASRTSTASLTPTWTATASSTATPTVTRTPTGTLPPTSTLTASSTRTLSSTATASSTASASRTSTASSTTTASPTATSSLSATRTATQTSTRTSTASLTPTGTLPPTSTSTASSTRTLSSTATATATASETRTASTTATSTFSRTATPTSTVTSTRTETSTLTASPTFTSTATSTSTFTVTPTPTATSTPTSTPTPTPGVSLAKSPSKASATRGDLLTYTLDLTITGSPASGVTVTDLLPPEVTFAGFGPLVPPVTGAQTAQAGSTLTWSFPALSPGLYRISYDVTVASDLTMGVTLWNRAQASLPTGAASAVTARVDVPAPYRVEVTLFNEAGERVRTLYVGSSFDRIDTMDLSSAVLTQVDGTVSVLVQGRVLTVWDGRNQAGDPVSNGVYILQLDVEDPYGTVTSVTRNITVDRVLDRVDVVVFNEAGEVVRHLYEEVADPSGGTDLTLRLSTSVIAPGAPPGGAIPSSVGLQVGLAGTEVPLSWDGTNDGGTAVTNGRYLVQVHWSHQGEDRTLTREVTVQAPATPTGIGKVTAQPPVLNGATGSVTLTLSPPKGSTLEVKLYDVAGELVRKASGPPGGDQVGLDMGGLASGFYLAWVEVRGPSGLKERQVLRLLVRR